MKFIVIDGLDGAGKDTQSQLLYNDYKQKGCNVVLRSHPSIDTIYGRKSKEALLKSGKLNHLKATVFYGLDVISSVKTYFNKDNIDILIFSRYTLAVVYLPNIINVIIYKIVCIVLPTSPYMFFLDVTPDVSLRRLSSRGEKEQMFENKDALIKARKKSLKIIYNWNYIDANRDVLSVNRDIKKIIKNK